ncbi:MAG: hypothetical protein JW715_00490 [Sedimentisphaerales bacterium]|nr:hypothetical protein [Sedimentisphaerales bacterium]
MKEEMSIDELLNGFVDGELTTREETEVRRLIENDPQIARRLQQLQKCKVLMNSLPASKAPAGILDGVRASMRAGTQQEMPQTYHKLTTSTKLFSRRLVSVAAMIGFVAVLTTVVITLSPTEGPDSTNSGPFVASASGFNGKLEMKTADFIAVDSFLKRTIEDNGFTDSLSEIRETNRHVYTIRCGKKGLDSLLADLDNIWDKLDSAKLLVETGEFGEQVAINEVTTEQISKIAGQQSFDKSIEVAKDFAVLNNVNGQLPGREILSSIDNKTGGLLKIDKPFLTSKIIEKRDVQDDEEKTVHLTIIINR